MVVLNSVDEKTWREFVDQHPQGNIFHTPEMFQVFMHAHGHKPQLFAALDNDKKVFALFLPVHVSLLNGPLRRLTTRSIAYGGVLCSDGESADCGLEILLVDYSRSARKESLFTELRNLSDQSVILPVLERNGFAYEEHLNYLINMDCSSEQLLQNIGSRTRKHIRQALRRGNITINEITEPVQLPSWYELIQKTYHAARVPLADISLFKTAFDILQRRGMIKFWTARLGPAVIAASAELLYKDKIYGWYGGVDRRYADETPGELLMWHILDWGRANGYKIYDFGGAGKPTEAYGVRDFKAKFGGKLVCYGRNTKVHSPALFRLSGLGYRIYRHLI